ncbi:hypothetical protein FACS1894180_0900 [Bacteroidia bacterium]|nr:hypothetical protein FACS1894180_0900 [Bacteroidia bacterium]
MKNLLTYILLTFPLAVFGQSSDQNYIKTTTYAGLTGTDEIVTIQYFDGLGRPVETVQKGITPDGKDLVSYQEYDNFGRASNAWLPRKANQSNGNFVPGQAFTALDNSVYQNDAKPYAKTVYEPSPLNRVMEQYGAGQDWHDNSKAVKIEYLANSVHAYPCIYYSLSGSSVVNGGNYASAQLYVTKTTSEVGNISFEFKDKLGQVVLTRQMDGNTKFDTYYIYDDFGNLCAVLPPLAADGFTAGSKNLNDELLKKYAYVYQYDARNRCIYKRLPGCEPVYYVYDKADRLIFTQDGALRAKNSNYWLMTVPDKFGRPCLTLLVSKVINYAASPLATSIVTASRTNLTNALFGYAINMEPYSIMGIMVGKTRVVLAVNYYDDYLFLGSNGIDTGKYGYEDAGSSYGARYTTNEAYCYKGKLTGTIVAYNKTADTAEPFVFPLDDLQLDPKELAERFSKLTGTLFEIGYFKTVEVNKFLDLTAAKNKDGKDETANEIAWTGELLIDATAGRTATLKTGFLVSVMYYDQRGRVVQTRANNHLGGMEKEYVAYNFTGQPLKRKHTHNPYENDPASSAITEIYDYQYDHAGRPTITIHALNNGRPKILTHNLYDPIGRIRITGPMSDNSIQTAYEYNIRSWIEKINAANNTFSQVLVYTYGGNVGTMRIAQAGISAGLSMSGTTNQKTFDYFYDQLSRLKNVYLSTRQRSEKYTSYDYDKHGNILMLERWDNSQRSYLDPIDRLKLAYNGNQLISVADNGRLPANLSYADFKDYANEEYEYTYNANGAMTKDLNKGIQSITYNELSLPLKIEIATLALGGTNEYKYTSTGIKLHVTHNWNANINGSVIGGSSAEQRQETDYIGNKIYENGKLKMILTDNGYIQDDEYFFYIKDHLGNNRIVVNESGHIVQSTDYYPYGLPTPDAVSTETQPYKYNGKELDNISGLNLYDYGARHNDPVLGRFTTMDRFCEKYYSISPYSHAAGNPLRYIDVNGDSLMLFKDGVYVSTVDNGKTEMTGFNQRTSVDKNGNETFVGGESFSFNDAEVDPQAVRNGVINKVEFVSDATVNSHIDRSGANSHSGIGYAYPESHGGGKMDYGYQGIEIYGDLNKNTFYVRDGTAYNVADFGNYLWGRGMAALGIDIGVAQIGAHWNNFWNGRQGRDNYSQYDFGPGTYGAVGLFDSVADQRAIINGYRSLIKHVAQPKFVMPANPWLIK